MYGFDYPRITHELPHDYLSHLSHLSRP